MSFAGTREPFSRLCNLELGRQSSHLHARDLISMCAKRPFQFGDAPLPPELLPFEATSAFTLVTARWLAHHPEGGFVDGLQVIGSLLPAIQATGLLALAPEGLVSL